MSVLHILLFLALHVELSVEFFTYEFMFSDYIAKNGAVMEVGHIANRIHCASVCFREPECSGFAYDMQKNCTLFDIFLDKDYCSEENCTPRTGVKTYMVNFINLHIFLY